MLQFSFLLAGLEGIAATLWIASTRSAEGSVLFGLSAFRLGLEAAILLTSTGFLYLGWQWRKESALTRQISSLLEKHAQLLILGTFWGAVAFFLFQSEAYFKLFLRPVKTIDPDLFFLRLRPVLVWITLILIQFGVALVLAFKEKLSQLNSQEQSFIAWVVLGITGWLNNNRKPKKKSRQQRSFQRTWIEVLIWLVLLIVWILIDITGVGIIPDDRFWNVAGVPVLPQQVILIGLLLLLMMDIKHAMPDSRLSQISQKRAFPFILIAGLWLLAVLVWNGETLYHTYFSPGPYPPNFIHYPFSDARAFDVGGQYYLLGKGLNNNSLTDRPFLMLFFAFLHASGGQNFDQYILVQVMTMALIPALLFLFGWKIHSKTAGIGMALLLIFKEKNAITAANEIGLVNVKVLMSELPTALLLIALSLCLFYWFRAGKSVKLLPPLLAGGILGLAVGVRGNCLALLPVVLVLTILIYITQKGWFKPWAISTGLFLLCFIIVLAPYSIKTTQQRGAPFWWSKILIVINRAVPESSLENKIIKTTAKFKLQTPENLNDLDINPVNTELSENIFTLSIRHLAHNEIMSVFSLPLDWNVSPIDALTATPLWNYNVEWAGELQIDQKLNLAVNLLILAAGIGYALRRWGINGLTPLALHLGYNLSNSFSRTSGGRYLVPADWVILFYFVLGFLGIVALFRNLHIPHSESLPTTSSKKNIIGAFGVIIAFLLLGSAFLFSGLIPEKFTNNTPNESLATLGKPEWESLDAEGISPDMVNAFIKSSGSTVEFGFVLYPRFLQAGETAIRSSHIPVMPANQDRITFLVLTDAGPRYILLPLVDQYPKEFPHAVYGLIIGCQKENYVEGKIFIPLTGSDKKVAIQLPFNWSCETP